MNNATRIITQTQQALTSLAIPIAIVCVIIIGLSMIAAPAAKNWSRETRSTLGWVLGGVVLVMLASSVVAITSIFGNG